MKRKTLQIVHVNQSKVTTLQIFKGLQGKLQQKHRNCMQSDEFDIRFDFLCTESLELQHVIHKLLLSSTIWKSVGFDCVALGLGTIGGERIAPRFKIFWLWLRVHGVTRQQRGIFFATNLLHQFKDIIFCVKKQRKMKRLCLVIRIGRYAHHHVVMHSCWIA